MERGREYPGSEKRSWIERNWRKWRKWKRVDEV